MKNNGISVVFALLALVFPTPAFTASPAEIAAQRQEALDGILHRDTAYTVAAERKICAAGKMPAHVSEQRAAGAAFYPDAADMCVAVLVRTAKDGRLPELYVKLLGEAGGDRSQAAVLAQTIGGAALANQKAAPIGNGKGMVITPCPRVRCWICCRGGRPRGYGRLRKREPVTGTRRSLSCSATGRRDVLFRGIHVRVAGGSRTNFVRALGG